MEKCSILQINENKRSYGLFYHSHQAQFNMDARDFMEKGFAFYHEGSFYRYCTTLPNSEKYKDVPSKTVRGKTLINIAKMSRDPETKKVVLQTLS